jgi:hypothetical protein
MIIFSLLWLAHINMFDGFDFMNDVMDYRDLITKNILNIKNGDDIRTKYLLISTSNNNQLLASDNDNQLNTVITDRKELCRVLNILDHFSNKVRYIVCDVIFDEPSDSLYDTDLKEVMTRLDKKSKIVLPFYIDEGNENRLSYSIFKTNSGLSQYRFSFLNTQFLKFSYILFDTIKQMPLVAFEDITGKKMEKRKFIGLNYYTLDNKWCLNTIIPEFRYTSNDLNENNCFDLGLFTSDFLGENQVVMIGDFEGIRDRHHSIVDQVAGPLIVLNVLESLFHGDNLIGIPYLFMLYFFFFIISYHTFYKAKIKVYYSSRAKPNFFIEYIRSNINYLTILILTLISMLFFNHYLHLLILLGYFVFIEVTFSVLNKYKKEKVVNDQKSPI